MKFYRLNYKTYTENYDENQLFFVEPPKEIGEVISAKSTLYQKPEKDKEYYNTFVGDKGVAVYVLKNGEINGEIIFYDDKFEENIEKYKFLEDFYAASYMEYLSEVAEKFQKDLLEGKSVEINSGNLKIVFSKNDFKLFQNGKLEIDGLYGFKIVDFEVVLTDYELNSFILPLNLKTKALFEIYSRIYTPDKEKFQKAKNEFTKIKNRKIKRNLIISVIAGFVIVFALYIKIKYSYHFEKEYDFYSFFNNQLFGVSMVGFLISAVLWKIDFFKYLAISMVIVFLGFVLTYDKAERDKRIYLENFSNKPVTVTVNGKKYTIDKHSSEMFDFGKGNVKVNGYEIDYKGCYIVNLNYPKYYYKYGLIQHFSLNGISFNTVTMIGEIDDKIYQIDKHPNCWVTKVKEYFGSGESEYYIEGVKKE